MQSADESEERVLLGELLAEIGREAELVEAEVALFEEMRDKSPSNPVCFD